LAKLGTGKVSPNPMVGCIIVKENEIIGYGYHKEFGQDHAEVNAIKNAPSDIRGSTVYINLEPCSYHGKTPPCVDLLIEKKIARVVCGTIDPNPLVNGRSIRKLRKIF
jgi:diaminohydroxyphosphoribosylaminopyrimidine deaminase/5-amino-6-(5-phosphoribosylamino)uracil reductase